MAPVPAVQRWGDSTDLSAHDDAMVAWRPLRWKRRRDKEAAVNGFIKIWRKEQASEIWDQPPELYKLWHWILLNVNYKTATIEHTSTQIAKALRLPELPDKDQIRKGLKWLETRDMIELDLYGKGGQRGYRITVKNWAEYQSESDRTENAPRTHRGLIQ